MNSAPSKGRGYQTRSIGWWITRMLIAAPLSLAVCLVALIGLNYTGFCFEARRFLSDQDKYRLVVEKMIQNRIPFEPVKPFRPGRNYWSAQEGDKISHWLIKGHDGPVDPIDYRTPAEFFAINPTCCEIRPFLDTSEGSFSPSFWERALGDCSGGTVRVTGISRFRDHLGAERQTTSVSEYLLSNCGRVVGVPLLDVMRDI